MTARAVAIVYLPDEDRCYHTPYTDETVDDPLTYTRAFAKSCADDFPGGMWAVTGNEEATKIRSDRMMKAMGLDPAEAEGQER